MGEWIIKKMGVKAIQRCCKCCSGIPNSNWGQVFQKWKKVAEILFANQSNSQRSTDQWENRPSHSEQMEPPTNACQTWVWIWKCQLISSSIMSGQLQNKSSCHLWTAKVWIAISLSTEVAQWLITERVYTCHLMNS